METKITHFKDRIFKTLLSLITVKIYIDIAAKHLAYLKDRAQWAAILSSVEVTYMVCSVSTRNVPHCEPGVFMSGQNTGYLVFP